MKPVRDKIWHGLVNPVDKDISDHFQNYGLTQTIFTHFVVGMMVQIRQIKTRRMNDPWWVEMTDEEFIDAYH